MDVNSILEISKIKEGNKELIQLKIARIPIFAKMIFIYAGIITLLFIVFILSFLSALPLVFKIGIPIMLFFMLFILYLTGSQIKHMALVLSKRGDSLYIKRVFSKSKIFEKTIKLKNPKLVLVSFPISLGHYQLLLKNGGKLESLIPVEWDVVKKFPIIHPRMKKFLYSPENARQLSKLLKIPLEESKKHFNQYLSEFKN